MLKNIFTGFLAAASLASLSIPASAVTLTVTFDTRMDIELRNQLGVPETLVLTGTTVWNAMFEGSSLGDAADDDGDGLGEIEIEMLSMNLTGTSSLLSDGVQLQLLGGVPAVGEIEEDSNNDPSALDLSPYGSPSGGAATSRFDLRFDIVSSAGAFQGSTSGIQGLSFRALLVDFPGLNTTYNSFATVLLVDDFGSTGYTLGPGEFVFSSTVVPVPATVWLFGSGLLGLIGIAMRKKT